MECRLVFFRHPSVDSASEAWTEVPLGYSRWREENHCGDRGHRDSADTPPGGEDQDLRAKGRVSFKIPSHLPEVLTSLRGRSWTGDVVLSSRSCCSLVGDAVGVEGHGSLSWLAPREALGTSLLCPSICRDEIAWLSPPHSPERRSKHFLER